MRNDKLFASFIDSCRKKYNKLVGFDNKYNWYCYSTHVGKFYISNALLDILIEDFSPIEVSFFLDIIRRVKSSKDFLESGVVYVKRSEYNVKYKNIFKPSLIKYVDYGFFIKTPKHNVFVMNPLYINKFYKTKELQ